MNSSMSLPTTCQDHHTLDWKGEIALYDGERAMTNTAGLNQYQIFSNDERHLIPSKWPNLQSGLYLLA